MRREISTFVFASLGLLGLGSLSTGCLKDSHRLDGSMAVVAPTSSWLIPLGSFSFSTDDLSENFMEPSGVGVVGSAFLWKDTLAALHADPSSWLVLESDSYSMVRAFSSEEVLAFSLLPSGETSTYELQESLEVSLMEGCVVHQLEFAGGVLRCKLTAPEGMNVSSTISLPSLTRNGMPMEVVCTANGSVDWPLDDATLLFPADASALEVLGLLQLTSGAQPMTEGTNLQWQFEWIEPVLNRFEGLLLNQDPLVFEEAMTIETPSWLQGDMALTEAAMVLEVENGQGLRLGLGFEGELIGSQMNSSFQWQPVQPAVIDAASVGGTSMTSTLKLDNTNTAPPIGSWLSPELAGIQFRSSLEVLPPKSQWQFVEANGSISIHPALEIPFVGYAERIELSDTVALDLHDLLSMKLPEPFSLQQLERLAVQLEVINGLPLGLEAQMVFYNANDERIETVLDKPVQLLSPPSLAWVGAFQVPEEASATRWDVGFAGADLIELLEQDVQYLVVTVVGTTPSAGEQTPVAFGPGQTMDLNASLAIELNPSLP